MDTTPARDALYDALTTGTQHAQIRQHLIDAAIAEDRAAHAAEVRAAALDQALDVAHEEGHRLEAEIGIEAARGARCVAYLLRHLAATDTEMAASLTRDGFGPSEIARQTAHAAAARPDNTTGA